MGRKKISSEVKETVNEVKETANGVKETDISEESSNVIITESGQEIIPASKENKQLLVDVSPKDTPKMVTGGLISYEDQINRGIELMKKGIQGRLLIGQALVNIKAKEDLTELGYSIFMIFVTISLEWAGQLLITVCFCIRSCHILILKLMNQSWKKNTKNLIFPNYQNFVR